MYCRPIRWKQIASLYVNFGANRFVRSRNAHQVLVGWIKIPRQNNSCDWSRPSKFTKIQRQCKRSICLLHWPNKIVEGECNRNPYPSILQVFESPQECNIAFGYYLSEGLRGHYCYFSPWSVNHIGNLSIIGNIYLLYMYWG